MKMFNTLWNRFQLRPRVAKVDILLRLNGQVRVPRANPCLNILVGVRAGAGQPFERCMV